MVRSIILRIYRAKTGKPDPMHAAMVAHAPNAPPIHHELQEVG